MGSFFARPSVSNLLPRGTSLVYCADWMFVGRECSAGYGMCHRQHTRFDHIRIADDKAMIADHITVTEGLFFSRRDVRSLTKDHQKRKLVDELPPGP